MIPKVLDSIVDSDIASLLLNQVREGRALEYKRDLPGSTDSDKKEFLADVSSFANTVGGDLIFGIDESDGVPSVILGLPGANLDAEQQRLDSIILAGIEPRIPYRMRSVATSNGASVLILRMEQSWAGPHRIVFKQHDRFYARNSTGKYSLDTGELRQAFMGASSIVESIGRFRDERLIEIGSGRTPVVLSGDARLVLHLVPLQAFASRIRFDVPALQGVQQHLRPMSAHGWSNRITLHGFVTFTSDGTSSINYTHLYRSGIVEAVDAYILSAGDDGRKVLPSVAFEQRLIQTTDLYLDALSQLGVQPPIYCFLSLLGAKGATMGIDAYRLGLYSLAPMTDDTVTLPESVLTDFEGGAVKLLREPINAIWNAFGFERSPHFDSAGAWNPGR